MNVVVSKKDILFTEREKSSIVVMVSTCDSHFLKARTSRRFLWEDSTSHHLSEGKGRRGTKYGLGLRRCLNDEDGLKQLRKVAPIPHAIKFRFSKPHQATCQGFILIGCGYSDTTNWVF